MRIQDEPMLSSPEIFWANAKKYFDWCNQNPMKEKTTLSRDGNPVEVTVLKVRPYTMNGLCQYLGPLVHYRDHLEKHLTEDDNTRYLEVFALIEKAINVRDEQIKNETKKSLYNPNRYATPEEKEKRIDELIKKGQEDS